MTGLQRNKRLITLLVALNLILFCGLIADKTIISRIQADAFFYKTETKTALHYLAGFNGEIFVVQGKKTTNLSKIAKGNDTIYVYKSIPKKSSSASINYKIISHISKNNLLIVNKEKKFAYDKSVKLLRLAASKYYDFSAGMSLNKEALNSLWVMLKQAYNNGQKEIYLTSGYRSVASQTAIFKDYVKSYKISSSGSESKEDIEKLVNETVAKPGFSEHQTGLAVDMVSKGASRLTFKNTKFYAWLVNNSYLYGFVERYPKGKERITGYDWETWHLRYVGLPYSSYLFKKDMTLDEFYNKSKSGDIINIEYKDKIYSVVYVKGAKNIYIEKGLNVQMFKISGNEYFLVLVRK